MSEGRAAPLLSRLRDGLAAAPSRVLRDELGLPETAGDESTARALIASASAASLDRAASVHAARADDRVLLVQPPIAPADPSFLGRLGAAGVVGEGGKMVVSELDDVRTLLAVLRAGTLRQRRGAVVRLAAKLGAGQPTETAREISATLHQIRDVDVAYERSCALVDVGGPVGRDVRAELDQWSALAQAVDAGCRAYWSEDDQAEPVLALPGDQRATLFLRARDLPDTTMAHVAALIEGDAPDTSRDARLGLVSSLRHAGDPRLVPSLAALLDGPDVDLAVEAARALARIDDPRVHPALVGAYERAVLDHHRAVLGGALGHTGDVRAASYVRGLVERRDPRSLTLALEALETVGGSEDVALVTRAVDVDDPLLRVVAARTLGRIGDARAIAVLESIGQRANVSATWAEIDDALAAIRARLELRGEVTDADGQPTPPRSVAPPAFGGRADRAESLQRSVPSMRVRLASYWDQLAGELWLVFGAVDRAVVRFESAAARQPEWSLPLVTVAMAYARYQRFAQALGAFRRAVEVDRGRVERQPSVVRQLVLAFLRRAEEMERAGRNEIARGLLEEVLALDLRRAPSSLRFEVSRRHDALRRRDAS